MKQDIQKRREYMMKEYFRTFSEQQAIKATSQKFQVGTNTLYMDWSRRDNWLKDMVKLTGNSNLI